MDIQTNEGFIKETASFIKDAAVVVSALKKLKQAFSKWSNRKRDAKKLAEDVAELQKEFQTLVDAMFLSASKHKENLTRLHDFLQHLHDDLLPKAIHRRDRNEALLLALGERTNGITTIALGHERRINALESSRAAGKNKKSRKSK